MTNKESKYYSLVTYFHSNNGTGVVDVEHDDKFTTKSHYEELTRDILKECNYKSITISNILTVLNK